MPDSLEAALVFSILIVPGYLLLRGYYLGRAHTVPSQDLYLLAQAVVASLIWLAVTWIVVEDLLRWINQDEVGKHEAEAYLIGSLLVVVPYAVGRVGGYLVTLSGSAAEDETGWVSQARNLARRFVPRIRRFVGAVEFPTAWEYAWAKHSRAFVRIVLDDNQTILGMYAGESRVDVSPTPRQLFLERTYKTDSDGRIVGVGGSIYVDGSKVVSLEFIEGPGS